MFAHSGRSMYDVSVPNRTHESVESRRDKASLFIKKGSGKNKRNFDEKENTFIHNHIRGAMTVTFIGKVILFFGNKVPQVVESGKVNTKLDELYSGPQIINKVIGNNRYSIRSIKGLRGCQSFTGLDLSSVSLRPYTSVARHQIEPVVSMTNLKLKI